MGHPRCEHNSSSAWVRRYLRPGPVLDDSNTCDNIRGSLGREAGSRVCTKSAVTEVSPAPAPGNTHSVVCSLCLLTGIRKLSTSHLTLDHNYIALMSANTSVIITITLPLFDIQSCLDISRCWSVWRLQCVTAGSMQQCCSALRLPWHASTDWPGTVQPVHWSLYSVQYTVQCTYCHHMQPALWLLSQTFQPQSHIIRFGEVLITVLWRYIISAYSRYLAEGEGGVIYPQICLQRAGTQTQ